MAADKILNPTLSISVDGKDVDAKSVKFCTGINRKVVLWIGYEVKPGLNITKVTWKAGGKPLDPALWNGGIRCLTLTNLTSGVTEYIGTFEYDYKGKSMSEDVKASISVYNKPTIEFVDTRFKDGATASLCGGEGSIDLKPLDKDWNLTILEGERAFQFKGGKFVYKLGGTDAGEEIPFNFTVAVKDYEECSASFKSTVKVYKPKAIRVDLSGSFCAGGKPMEESFNEFPNGGISSVSLYKRGNAAEEWKKTVDKAKITQIAEAGLYEVKTNYSFVLPGTADVQCRSEEVKNDFRLVAVPAAPAWDLTTLANPLQVCDAAAVKLTATPLSEEGVTYVYTLKPDGTVQKSVVGGNGNQSDVGFELHETGKYTVHLALKDVKGCPELKSSELDVKMQGELEGDRISPVPSVLLCADFDQALNPDEQKIGYSNIRMKGGGEADGYVYRWMYGNQWTADSKDNGAKTQELTFKPDGSGTGQQGSIKPKEGDNEYVLQYKLVKADVGCWKTLGEKFGVTVTAKIIGNDISTTSKGVCTGVEAKITGKKISNGCTYQWLEGGNDVPGQTGADYSGDVKAGEYARRVISGGCVHESQPVQVVQYNDPQIELESTELPHCREMEDGTIAVRATAPVGETVAFSYDGGKTFESFIPVGSKASKDRLKSGTEFKIVGKTTRGCVSNELSVNLKVESFKLEDLAPSVAPCWGKKVQVPLKWSGGALRAGESYFVMVAKANEAPEPAVEIKGRTEWSKELPAGKYHVSVTFPERNGGCKAERDFEVQDPKELDPEAYPALCPGGKEGVIRATLENAAGVRYVLERDSAGVKVLERVNTDGLFIGLRKGKYAVRAILSSSCATPIKEVTVGGDDMPSIAWGAAGKEVKCPGGVVDQIEATVTPAAGYTNYIWSCKLAQQLTYITTRQPRLLDAGVGKYSLTLVRDDGCVVHSDTLEVTGPEPFTWQPEPTITAAECDGYMGKTESKGSVILYGIKGGNAPQAWWESTPNAEDKDQPVKYNTTYYLRSGLWKVRIKDGNGCKGELAVEVGYNPDNSVRFLLRHSKEGKSLCFGERLQSVRIEEDASSKSEMDKTVLPEVTLEREERGGLLVETLSRAADGTYSSLRGVEPGAVLRAVVQSKKGCRSELKTPISVYPAIKVQYDPLLSNIDVFFRQRVEDKKRSWRGSNGRTIYQVMKDSIVAGVLAGVPRRVGVEVEYLPHLQDGLTYTTDPEGVYTQDKDRRNVFDVALSANAIEKYRAAGRVVSARFGRRPLEVLRTTIRVADPKTGCAQDFDLYIRLIRELSIPNVFTPNGDGVNDRWLSNSDPIYQTIFSKLTSLLPNIEVEVFNRAGARVWHAKADKVAEGWDGTSGGMYGGAELPVGTYYYVIRFNIEGVNSWKPISGSVTIVR